MPDKIEGYLEVGVDPKTFEVVINYTDLKPDSNGAGHIVFSPDQARALSEILRNKANEAEYEHASTISPAVHALQFGFPVCGFVRAVPSGWPPGHTWDDVDRVTCAGCLDEIAKRQAVKEA